MDNNRFLHKNEFNLIKVKLSVFQNSLPNPSLYFIFLIIFKVLRKKRNLLYESFAHGLNGHLKLVICKRIIRITYHLEKEEIVI